MVTFGPKFARALCLGSAKLSSLGSIVPIEWILEIIPLESAGTWDPNVLQGRAKIVPETGSDDTRPEIAGQPGMHLSLGNGARGLFQVMPRRTVREKKPVLLTLYSENDPVKQLENAIDRFYSSAKAGKYTYKYRESLYCANLAPARLINGNYTRDTILYSANPEDIPLNKMGIEYTKTYWPQAFFDNAPAFDIDTNAARNPDQRLRMKDLLVGLDKAVAATKDRYNAELEAAYFANLQG